MVDAAAAAPTECSRPRLGAAVVPLLAVCVFINYVDRGNLATAGSSVQGELALSSTRASTLYAIGQTLAVLVDRTGHFAWAFLVAGAVTLLALVGWVVLIRRVAPLEWGSGSTP
jgi:hypothetical protein